jgi:RNA polymerase sigma-70 factor, ECF subfamily
MNDAAAERLSELMRRYSRGEDEVFELLYTSMSPRLYRFCVRLAGNRPDADDLFQETFLRIHRARATYLPGANAMHWAFAIARAVNLDRVRYRRRRPEQPHPANDAAEDDRLRADDRYSPEAEAQTHELVEVVTLELDRMSEKNRVAYSLLQEEGLSVKEAAAVLGTTPDVVKQRAHRAYERLRTAVGAGGWNDCPDAARTAVRNRARADPA